MSRAMRAALGVVLITLCAARAQAWKPNTHVYFAEQARLNAVSSGTVWINRVNHFGRATTGGGANYAVDPTILAALTQYPAHFRAGVLGPDAYPDLLTGQSAIHPDANHAGGADRWLRLLWRAKQNNDLRQVAFVVGFLAHAAGDMYGHTLVNSYSGAPWTLDDPNNPVKHILVEGYVGTKTPAVSTDISIDGLHDFIYANLINAPPGSEQDSLLAETAHQTVPGIFNNLRERLVNDINDYYNDVQYLRDKIDSIAAPLDLPWRIALGTLQATRGLWTAYEEAWVDDIDRGLRAWPATSHEVAKVLLLPATGVADTRAARMILEDYWFDYMLSMLGAPDLAGEILGAINDVLDMILEPWRKLKERIIDYLLETATGRGTDEWRDYLTDPARYLDSRVGPGTQAQLDIHMGITTTQVRFTPATFAAGHNTVTMIKLLFLSPAAREKLMRDFGYGGGWPMFNDDGEDNAMLGFIKSLDGDNEWRRNPRPMLAARECHTYTQLFMNQPGEPTSQAPFKYRYGDYTVWVDSECPALAAVTLNGGSNGTPFCGTTLTGEVVLNRKAEAHGAVVDLSHDALISTSLPDRVWLAPGELRKSFNVPLLNQNQVGTVPDITGTRMDKSFNASRTVKLAKITSMAIHQASKIMPAGQTLTGQFHFDCTALPSTITLSSTGILNSPRTVSIPGGSTVHAFSVPTKPNVSGNYILTASLNGVLVSDTFTLLSQRVSNLSFNTVNLAIGTPTTGTVTLAQPAPAGGQQVTLTYPSLLTGPATVTVPAGASSTTFVLTANGSPIPAQSQAIVVSARAPQDDPSVAKTFTLQWIVLQQPVRP